MPLNQRGTVDEAVAERLLGALNPEEVALALAADDEVADRRARRSRATDLALKRARYEAERAERAFLRLRAGEPSRGPQPRGPPLPPAVS